MPAHPDTSETKPATDWEVVRARLARAVSSLGNSAELSPAREREVLLRRAAALAQREQGAAGVPSDALPVVAFELGEQVYGFDGACVRETVPPREVTRLPGLPPTVSGLVNIRSRVVPAFDLRPLLNVPTPPAAAQRLLVLTHEGADFAIVADRVIGSRELSLQTLRRGVSGLNDTYVRGIAEDGLVLLDLPAVAADLEVQDRAAM
jgi:chemotaxis signal transduction protein